MSSFSPVCTGWMEATPLHYAAKEGHTEVAKILLEKQAAIDPLDENECTPLHHAAQWGHTATVKLLLENKASIDKVGGYMEGRPLHYASKEGNTDTGTQPFNRAYS